MGLKYDNLDKIKRIFYEYPEKQFTVRELAKKTRIPKSTVHKYLSGLKNSRRVTKENKSANTALFKTEKTFFYIRELFESDFIEYLTENLRPACIILFGSFRKGESAKESDIDLFVETLKKPNLNLAKFEKILGHKIQLFIEEDINNLPDNLFNNVVNGIKLKGFFKIR
jgi:predicted nucleotidyltransferase